MGAIFRRLAEFKVNPEKNTIEITIDVEAGKSPISMGKKFEEEKQLFRDRGWEFDSYSTIHQKMTLRNAITDISKYGIASSKCNIVD